MGHPCGTQFNLFMSTDGWRVRPSLSTARLNMDVALNVPEWRGEEKGRELADGQEREGKGGGVGWGGEE